MWEAVEEDLWLVSEWPKQCSLLILHSHSSFAHKVGLGWAGEPVLHLLWKYCSLSFYFFSYLPLGKEGLINTLKETKQKIFKQSICPDGDILVSQHPLLLCKEHAVCMRRAPPSNGYVGLLPFISNSCYPLCIYTFILLELKYLTNCFF